MIHISKSNKAKIAKLEKKLVEQNGTLAQNEEEAKKLKLGYRKIKENIGKTKKSMAEELNKSVTVTEHALLRYLERVEGYDLEELANKIVSPEVFDIVSTQTSRGVYEADNYQVCYRGRKIVTITTKKKK